MAEQAGRVRPESATEPRPALALPGLAVVAERRRGWRVLDVSGPLCMFSTATTGAGPPFDKACAQWNTDVLAWLGAHPGVHTISTGGQAAPVRQAPRRAVGGLRADQARRLIHGALGRRRRRRLGAPRRRAGAASDPASSPPRAAPPRTVTAGRGRRRPRAAPRGHRQRADVEELAFGGRGMQRRTRKVPTTLTPRCCSERPRRLDDQQHARADRHQRRGHLRSE